MMVDKDGRLGKADRATHEPNPQAVSAVPVGIADAAPRRVQLSRRKGWRMPENTVVVARPTKWGNPFSVLPGHPIGQRVGGARGYYAVPTVEDAVACYREMLTIHEGDTADGLRASLPELRDKNLACWCPLDAPCHADVLLELANAPRSEA
jgi:hypothetical protein